MFIMYTKLYKERIPIKKKKALLAWSLNLNILKMKASFYFDLMIRMYIYDKRDRAVTTPPAANGR